MANKPTTDFVEFLISGLLQFSTGGLSKEKNEMTDISLEEVAILFGLSKV